MWWCSGIDERQAIFTRATLLPDTIGRDDKQPAHHQHTDRAPDLPVIRVSEPFRNLPLADNQFPIVIAVEDSEYFDEHRPLENIQAQIRLALMHHPWEADKSRPAKVCALVRLLALFAAHVQA